MAKPGRPAKFTYTTPSGQRKLKKGLRRVHAFVDAEVVKRLKIIAAKREAPISDVIGEALAQYVKRTKA